MSEKCPCFLLIFGIWVEDKVGIKQNKTYRIKGIGEKIILL